MKKILIAGVLAAVVASPALAASKHSRNNDTQAASTQAASRPDTTAQEAYAYSPASQFVVLNGQVLGADPDPFIRSELAREGNPADYAGN